MGRWGRTNSWNSGAGATLCAERDGIYGDEHSNRKRRAVSSHLPCKKLRSMAGTENFFSALNGREFPCIQTRKMTPKCVFCCLFFPPETTLHAQQQTDNTTWADPAVIRQEPFHFHLNGWRRVCWNRPKLLSARNISRSL